MKFYSIKNNSYTPFVGTGWCKEYPEIDREYVWYYPLQYGGNAFNPKNIFTKAKVPLASNDGVVYIHVPACLFRCAICPFYVELIESRRELLGYAQAIIQELRMYTKAELTKHLNLKTIYFGGGTASLLYPEDIKCIIDEIKEIIPNNNNIEITLEGHPSTVDYNYLSSVHAYGVNRVSYGIQTFDQKTLSSLGLKQTVEENEKVLKDSLEIGFKTVAADLLYRTPNQSLEDLKVQLDRYFDIGVHSISTYSLELSVRQGALFNKLPSEEDDKEMFYFINNYMKEKGWIHIAQPDYAHPDHIQQELLTSWKAPQGQIIGLGAGACSSFNGNNYYNVHDIKEYLNVVSEGCLPVLTGQEYSLADALSRYMVLGVRCFEISKSNFENKFGKKIDKLFESEIKELVEKGLIEADDLIRVTEKGKYYIDNISKKFYTNDNKGHLQPWGEKMKGAISNFYLKVD